MLATDNTVSGWSQVIRDLQAKQATNNSQIEELRATKKVPRTRSAHGKRRGQEAA
jgi:hypothetical protein